MNQLGYYWGHVAAELTPDPRCRTDLQTGGLIFVSSLAGKLRCRLLMKGQWSRPALVTDQVGTASLEEQAALLFEAMFAARLAGGKFSEPDRANCIESLLERSVPIEVIEQCQQGFRISPASFLEKLEDITALECKLRVYVVSQLMVDADSLQGRRYLNLLSKALALPDGIAPRSAFECDTETVRVAPLTQKMTASAVSARVMSRAANNRVPVS